MRADNGEGQTTDFDGSLAIGGGNLAMRPMQTLLASLGACSSIDVILLLKKQRQPLRDLKLRIDADREEGKVPSLFTKINVHYDLYGDLKPAKVERALQLSMDELCSVGLMLKKQCPITYSYEIHA